MDLKQCDKPLSSLNEGEMPVLADSRIIYLPGQFNIRCILKISVIVIFNLIGFFLYSHPSVSRIHGGFVLGLTIDTKLCRCSSSIVSPWYLWFCICLFSQTPSCSSVVFIGKKICSSVWIHTIQTGDAQESMVFSSLFVFVCVCGIVHPFFSRN